MTIMRDFDRTEEDDFKLNVERYIDKSNRLAAWPLFNADGLLIGWTLRDWRLN